MPNRFAACPVESICSLIIGSSSDHRRVMSSVHVYSPRPPQGESWPNALHNKWPSSAYAHGRTRELPSLSHEHARQAAPEDRLLHVPPHRSGGEVLRHGRTASPRLRCRHGRTTRHTARWFREAQPQHPPFRSRAIEAWGPCSPYYSRGCVRAMAGWDPRRSPRRADTACLAHTRRSRARLKSGKGTKRDWRSRMVRPAGFEPAQTRLRRPVLCPG